MSDRALDVPEPAAPPARAGFGWGTTAIAVFAAAVTANALRQVWFYYDDFWNIAVAHLNGFGWTQLTHSVLGHFYPGYNLSFWAIFASGSAGYVRGAALTSLGIAGIAMLTAMIATQLGASKRAACCAAAATVAFGAWPAVTLWLSAATNSVPAALFCLLTLWLQVRWLQRQSHSGVSSHSRLRSGISLACVGLSFGCALSFYESAIFMVGPIVGVTALAFTYGTIGQRARQLFSFWPVWLTYVPPIAVLVTAFKVGPYGDEFTSQNGSAVTHPDLWTLIRVASKSVLDGLGTATIGLHPGRFDLFGSPVASNVAAATILGTGAIWLVRRTGLAGAMAIAFMTIPFLIRMGLAAWGRLTMLGWDIAHDVRYYADYAWVIPIVTIAAMAGSARPRTGHTHNGRSLSKALVAVMAIAAASTFIWRSNVVTDGSNQLITHRYYNEFRDSYNKLIASGADVSILDTLVPAELLGPQFGGFTHLSHTLSASFTNLPFNDPYAPLYAPDFTGKLEPAELVPVATLQPDLAFTTEEPVTTTSSERGSCWSAGAKTARLWIPLTQRVEPGFGVIRLDLGLDTTATDVPVLAAGIQPIGVIGSAVKHDWSRDRVLITSHYFAATQLGFDISPHRQLCISGGSISRLAPPVIG